MKFEPKNARYHNDQLRRTRRETYGVSHRQQLVLRAIIAGSCLVLAIILHFVAKGG